MTLRSLLKSLFGPALPRVPTQKENCRKTRAIWLLVRQGYITQRDIAKLGDNSPGKTIQRLRADGVLYADPDDVQGFDWVASGNGGNPYKRYKWTNKLPAALERRKTPRGAR
ncbi:hypothetical protein EN866_19415 [Mesorhizobium sp. M2D.F.Ca.ET.223.01.1.1]|uniref:hypothetical protein n=1 Tax=unclassified Mesorhizobium TaxID=325217 RepID=UPI000FCABDBD|nr:MULTISPECIES: hypothetical protein [unclassified Mesorhizobium]TGP89330.1 hypothetical protein EN864_19425 [bacterium M00.F.Ca.ET.221.01.1.1]TGP94703.1 hypothetical protein EN865_15295 [bacterium M00.F.Ca.ET.222.01.1.1]RVD58883.1 hypothetical protein EN783_14700 [Mesorhizobium sp. M2D.F.Ca.ET.140.01.1.1]TGP27912.1 hypothetical protein EN875_033185 [Mesorhizobium sp. M2D.F.Ca.ET.232.01.1.1]TGP75871.1 hypothetical protein EN867_15295 [Mesorhizobium sp. M2D.F.Ca.ET.224.01.1.1]